MNNKDSIKTDTPGPSSGEGVSYWNKWYGVVIVFLLIQVGLYYFITVYYK